MKKLYSILTAVLLTATAFAQSPEKMSYQAVVRDGSNALVASTTVGMQISILQGSSSGTAVYVETQTPTSNANGLVSVEIGGGTVVSGSFSTIDWANGPYYVKTETDPLGGTTYTIIGISQLLSVPYALYAKSVETDNVNDADADSTNELQSLSFTNDTLSLLNGGSVILPYDSAIWTKVNDTTISYNAVTINNTNASSADYDMKISRYINPYKALDIGRGVNGIRFDFGTTHESITAYTTGLKQFYIGTADSNNVNLKSYGLTRMTIAGDGKVGIGTTSPGAKLTVNGVAQFTDYVVPSSGKGLEIGFVPGINVGAITCFNRDTPTWQDLYINGSNVYIGTNSGVSKQLSITSNGIGISTSSPQRTLHINDVMRLEPRSSAPSSPGAGDIYYDSTLNKLMVYDGTIWQACW